MGKENKFSVLFQILGSEQQILQRADQKAFTMLSLLGVFSVFFVIHYTKIPATVLTLSVIFLYFIAILASIYFLVMVVAPRVRDTEEKTIHEDKTIVPTFFGGIIKYKSSDDYAKNLEAALDDPEFAYEVFAKSVYSIGRINAFKNKYLKYGIYSFVIAIGLEFIVIIALYVSLTMQTYK
jgi:hypothetical protein